MSDVRLDRVRQANQRRSDKRRAEVLAAAMVLARSDGFQWITRDAVASLVGCSAGLVSRTFGSMVDLKRAVLREAVRVEDLKIVAQGMADGHPIAMGAPLELRERAAAAITATA